MRAGEFSRRVPVLARAARKWLVRVGALAAASFCVWLAYGQGYQRGLAMHPILQLELEDLRERKREADHLIAQLSQETVKLRQGARIDRDVARQVRETVLATNEDMAALKEEIAFYRSLMAPSATEQGLGIRSFEVRATSEPRRYQFELVLQQRASKHKTLRGALDLSVGGRVNGKDVVLSLKELSADPAVQNVPFKFMYFQNLRGDLWLPEGFEPESVAIQARTWGRPSVRIEDSFTWLVDKD